MRVLNVDSQSSFNNIVVQVIGEMSNKSEPHHKFVQTFVLAEQPNGYFVLNDIFRYLNDDEDEIVEDEQPQAEVPAEEPPTPVDGLANTQKAAEETVATEEAAEEVDEKLGEEEPEPVEEIGAEVNGAVVPPTADETTVEAPESSVTTEGAFAGETVDISTPEPPTEPEAAQPESTVETTAPAPVEAPPAKKTWASMLGGGVKTPAVPALPVTTPAAQPKPARPSQTTPASKTPAEPAAATSNTTASTPTSQSNGWQTADHSKKGNRPQNKVAAEGVVLAYIKNVNEKVDARILRDVLESFGELKYFDVSRMRVC